MSVEDIKNALPEYAKDIKLNFDSIIREISGLTPQQQYGTLLASAIAARSEELRKAVAELCAEKGLSEEASNAAKAAAAVMAMNNIYYRSLHLMSDKEYLKMPANLRMNVIRNPGIDKVDFELYAIAVSSINGCDMCLDAHDKGLKDQGVSREIILQALRIAAIVHAVAVTIDDEQYEGHSLAQAAE